MMTCDHCGRTAHAEDFTIHRCRSCADYFCSSCYHADTEQEFDGVTTVECRDCETAHDPETGEDDRAAERAASWARR